MIFSVTSALCSLFWLLQAIQDITRCYDPPTEEIVTLIYEKVDINNEGKNDQHLEMYIYWNGVSLPIAQIGILEGGV